MPRKGGVPKRKIGLDPRFPDAPPEMRRRLTRLINGLMERGKRSVAENIVYGALEMVESRAKEDPLKVLDKALTNVKPRVEVKSRRVGGATYQVPVDVRPDRSTALGMRWLISYARERGEKGFRDKLAAEILDASAGRGNAVKKKDDTHKMAEANKAFAHYRW
jgi:small subunit ribosomal protein S7